MTIHNPPPPPPGSGGDGLLKVWTIKSGTSAVTEDAHDAKVWALTTAEDGALLATGADDASVKIWKVRDTATL